MPFLGVSSRHLLVKIGRIVYLNYQWFAMHVRAAFCDQHYLKYHSRQSSEKGFSVKAASPFEIVQSF